MMRLFYTVFMGLMLLGCKSKEEMTKEERLEYVEADYEFKRECAKHDHVATRKFIIDCVTSTKIDPKLYKVDREAIVEECSEQAYRYDRSCSVWALTYHDLGTNRPWLPCAGSTGDIKTLCDRWERTYRSSQKEEAEKKHVIVP